MEIISFKVYVHSKSYVIASRRRCRLLRDAASEIDHISPYIIEMHLHLYQVRRETNKLLRTLKQENRVSFACIESLRGSLVMRSRMSPLL